MKRYYREGHKLYVIFSHSRVEQLFEEALAAEETDDLIQAAKLYRTLLQSRPGCSSAWLNLGMVHYRLNHMYTAERCYRKAVHFDKDYTIGWFNLGNLYHELKKYEKAETAYKRALKIDSCYQDAYYNLAILYEDLKNPLQAIRCWKAYLSCGLDSMEWQSVAHRQLGLLRESVLVPKKAMQSNVSADVKRATR